MNTAKEYAALYQCEFTPTPRDNKLRELAQDYATRCETYDRTACTGPLMSGEITPANPRELFFVNQNAKRVIDEIVWRNPEFTRSEILYVAARLVP